MLPEPVTVAVQLLIEQEFAVRLGAVLGATSTDVFIVLLFMVLGATTVPRAGALLGSAARIVRSAVSGAVAPLTRSIRAALGERLCTYALVALGLVELYVPARASCSKCGGDITAEKVGEKIGGVSTPVGRAPLRMEVRGCRRCGLLHCGPYTYRWGTGLEVPKSGFQLAGTVDATSASGSASASVPILGASSSSGSSSSGSARLGSSVPGLPAAAQASSGTGPVDPRAPTDLRGPCTGSSSSPSIYVRVSGLDVVVLLRARHVYGCDSAMLAVMDHALYELYCGFGKLKAATKHLYEAIGALRGEDVSAVALEVPGTNDDDQQLWFVSRVWDALHRVGEAPAAIAAVNAAAAQPGLTQPQQTEALCAAAHESLVYFCSWYPYLQSWRPWTSFGCRDVIAEWIGTMLRVGELCYRVLSVSY